MKTITINEARDMVANMPIPRITGTIKCIWERKTGTNANGDWTMQSGILAHGEDEIRFTLTGLPDISQDFHVGNQIIFRCKEGTKGLSGVKIRIDDYKGKKEPILWITPSALILKAEEEPDDLEGLESPKPQQNAPKSNVEPKKAIPEDGLKQVKRRLMQYSNFRALCDAAVDYIYGEGASPELKKDVSSCFFIQGLREGLADKLPLNKPVEDKKPVNNKFQLPDEELAKEDVDF